MSFKTLQIYMQQNQHKQHQYQFVVIYHYHYIQLLQYILVVYWAARQEEKYGNYLNHNTLHGSDVVFILAEYKSLAI